MDLAIANRWAEARANPAEFALQPLSVPALIFTGDYDPLTPPSVAIRLHQFLSNSKLYVLPGKSHRRVAYEPCFRDVVAAFVAAPDTPPDDSCIFAAAGPPEFVVDVALVEGVYPFLTRLRYEPDALSAGGLLGSLVVFGLMFAGLPLYFVYRRYMLWPVPNWPSSARRTGWLLWVLAGVGLAYWGLFLGATLFTLRSTPLLLAFGLPGWARPILMLPYLLALLCLVAVDAVVQGWRRGTWRLRWRLLTTLFVLAALASVVYIGAFGLYLGG